MAKSEKTAMFLPVFLFIYKHHFLHLGFIDPLTYQMAGGKGSQPSSCQCYAMLSSMIIIFFIYSGIFIFFLKGKTSLVRGLQLPLPTSILFEDRNYISILTSYRDRNSFKVAAKFVPMLCNFTFQVETYFLHAKMASMTTNIFFFLGYPSILLKGNNSLIQRL